MSTPTVPKGTSAKYVEHVPPRQAPLIPYRPPRDPKPEAETPAPGSWRAWQQGCTCDRSGNEWGRGSALSCVARSVYQIAPDCPLHAGEA